MMSSPGKAESRVSTTWVIPIAPTPFWSTCVHRMACIGCDFNLPKTSAQGPTLESKASIRRYLEEVPLTADERPVVECDQEKIEGFIRKPEGVPARDGRTAR